MADQKLKKSAEELRSKGRGGDTILAHISPHEAAMLKMMGGSGTKNPHTGLPEFLVIYTEESGPRPGEPQIAGTTYYNTKAPTNSPGLFGGLSNEFAKLDPTPAISRAATDLFQPVEKAVSSGLADVDKNLSLSKNAPVFAAIALSFVIPVIGEAIGASLMEAGVVTSAAEASAAATAAGATAAQAAAAGAAATQTATAVGTAIANATRMVAQGSTIEQAITMSATSAAIGSQTPGIAKQIDDVVKNPAVTNLIASSAASAVQTAASGGSETDVINNVKGALIGSGVSSATGSSVAGRAAGGGVTGGVAGALIGAAGAAGAEAAKPAGTTTTSPQSGINLAAADTGTATDAGTGFRVDVPGAPIYAEQAAAVNVKAPFGYSVMPMSMADNKPEGSYYDTTQNAWLVPNADVQKLSSVLSEGDTGGQTPTSPTAAGTANVSVSGPVAGEGLVIAGDKGTGGGSSVSTADQKVLDLINPTPTPGQAAVATVDAPKTFTPAVAQRPDAPIRGPIIDNFPGPSTTPADQAVIDLTGIGGANVGGNVVVGPGADAGAGNASGNVVVGPGDEGGGPGGNVTIDAGEGGGNATSNVSGNVVVDEPPAEEVAPPAEEEEPPGEEEKPPGEKEDEYKPDLFIYGGVTPKAKPRTTTNLGTTLQAPFYPSSTLGQALTGYRGAGEIEGKKTGKPRRDVWNEESLRLKDALGL